jgi:hypothetical protein
MDATAHPTPLTTAQQASDVGVGGAELVALPGSDHAALPACDAPHPVAEGSLLRRQRCSSTAHPSEGDGSDSDAVRVVHSHPGPLPAHLALQQQSTSVEARQLLERQISAPSAQEAWR